MVGHHGFLHGYDIYYAGTTNYSGVCIMVRHELEPLLAFNDSSGRWIVLQFNVNGDILEFASVYAPQSSAQRASLWDSIGRYPWRSNAFVCGDFNNSPLRRDNTTSRSHMLSLERQRIMLLPWRGLLQTRNLIMHCSTLANTNPQAGMGSRLNFIFPFGMI